MGNVFSKLLPCITHTPFPSEETIAYDWDEGCSPNETNARLKCQLRTPELKAPLTRPQLHIECARQLQARFSIAGHDVRQSAFRARRNKTEGQGLLYMAGCTVSSRQYEVQNFGLGHLCFVCLSIKSFQRMRSTAASVPATPSPAHPFPSSHQETAAPPATYSWLESVVQGPMPRHRLHLWTQNRT